MFSNQSEKDLALKNIITQRVIKNLADTHNFNGTLWILNNFIVILQTEHKPFYLYELHEPGLAANLRFMFQLLWKKIKYIQVYQLAVLQRPYDASLAKYQFYVFLNLLKFQQSPRFACHQALR